MFLEGECGGHYIFIVVFTQLKERKVLFGYYITKYK